jgi:hypothetical protein
MREEEEAARPDRRRLPGFDEQAARGHPGYDWDTRDYGPPQGSYPQRRYARDIGVRASRRASSWTAAALIAAVAATTGYLAHSIPGTTTGGTTTGGTTTGSGTAGQAGKSTAARHGAPAVSGPVVTSGGSGAAAAGRAGGGGAGDN